MCANGLAMKCGRTAACFFVPGQKRVERKAPKSNEYELPYFMSRCYVQACFFNFDFF